MSNTSRLVLYDLLNATHDELAKVRLHLDAGHPFEARILLQISAARLTIMADKLLDKEES